jgi:hypothetical protein
VVVREVFSLERGALSLDTLGLGLAEGKDLLAGVQAVVAAEQVNVALAAQACTVPELCTWPVSCQFGFGD